MALIRNTSCQIPEEKPVLTLLPGVNSCLGWPFFPRKTQCRKGKGTHFHPYLTAPWAARASTVLHPAETLGRLGGGPHNFLGSVSLSSPSDSLTLWCHCGLGKSYLLPKQGKEKTEKIIPRQCHFGGNHSEECLNSCQQTGTALTVASESHS